MQGADRLTGFMEQEETQALLSSRWDEFAQHVTGGRELVDRIEMEEEELDELDDLLHGEVNFFTFFLCRWGGQR